MRLRTRILAATSFAISIAAPLQAGEPPPSGFTLTLAVREIYDENIYRLPDDTEPAATDTGASRDDYLSRASLGIEQQWQWSQQKVLIDLDASHNAYRFNDSLDNTAGDASAAWQWQAGRLSGEVAGDYSQSLASFANTRFLGRDLVDTSGASWKLGFRLGPRWSLRASGRHAESDHSAQARQFDNSINDSATFGLQLTTSSEHEIALSYRAARVDFEQVAMFGGLPVDRNYEERSGNLRAHYVWSKKTAFDGSVGYLEREYPGQALSATARGAFSGGVWSVAIKWQPTIRIDLDINGWRKLNAYLGAESDYFVGEGASLLSSWHLGDRIALSLEAAYETQDFLGSSANLLVAEGRRDHVRSGKMTMSYRVLRKLHLELSARLEDRESNRETLQYDARLASLGLRWEY